MQPDLYEDTLLAFDIDDNLYSWCDSFVPAFMDMAEFIIKETGWDEERLLSEFQTVHLAHHDTEYSASLKEIPLFQSLEEIDKEIADNLYRSARAVFDKGIKEYLEFFPGVPESLDNLRKMRDDIRENGKRCEIIAITDGRTKAIMDRLKALGLLTPENSFFDEIYAREENHTDALPRESWIDKALIGQFKERPREQKKPHSELLLGVIDERGYQRGVHKIWYSGDSGVSDVLMANMAAVRIAWNTEGSRRFHGKRLDFLLSINGLSKEHDERRQLVKGQQGLMRPTITFDNMHTGFMPMLMVTDEKGVYKHPRPPTPAEERMSAFKEREAYSKTVLENLNEAAEAVGKPHLKL